MNEREALTFTAVIPGTGTPIGPAGSVAEAGCIGTQLDMTARHMVERFVNLLGTV